MRVGEQQACRGHQVLPIPCLLISGLGRARGARWPCAVYMARQECACSTTIFACFLREDAVGKAGSCRGHSADAGSAPPGLPLAPDPWLLVQGWRRLCAPKPRAGRVVDGGSRGIPAKAPRCAREKRFPAFLPS